MLANSSTFLGLYVYDITFSLQRLRHILMDNAGIQKLQLNSTGMGDEVSLLLALHVYVRS